MPKSILTTGGDDYYWDDFGDPRPIQESAVRSNPPDESSSGRLITFTSQGGAAKVTINSGNAKTGPTLATHASNASCPNGRNNRAGYTCPWLANGCYADYGRQSFTTRRVNVAAGYSSSTKSARLSPEDVAEQEAEALNQAHDAWTKYRLNTGCRVHVVGDCVTPRAARILSDALDQYVTRLSGAMTRSFSDATNIWTYTHGWRSVRRSDWHRDISVLASTDATDPAGFLQELEDAYDQGYALSCVIPEYIHKAGQKANAAIKLSNGFSILPCAYEVGRVNKQNERTVCLECGWCMREDWLRKNRLVIGFAPHGTGSKRMKSTLISREEFIKFVG